MRNLQLSYKKILSIPGPFTDPDYEPSLAVEELSNANVLVIGAGGLGCEILKDLALSGIKRISVIDMDTIELTNLNRQFLFKVGDIGQSKAMVAAEVVMERVEGVSITPYLNRIQDFDDEFYRNFTIIVCGLDSIEARRWINSKIVGIAQNYDQIIPIIDGGTEGFQGSVKMIIPTITACFECYLPLIPDRVTYPLCTLASTPRLPEHCIEWAHQIEWGKKYSHEFNADDLGDVSKMYQLALERGKQYGIEGITKEKTLGVVKNIIPAIASTNAVVSGQVCNEAFKFLTSCNPNMKDSMYYNGENGVLFETDEYHKLPDCAVCGIKRVKLTVENGTSIGQFVSKIKDAYKLIKPLFIKDDKELFNFKFDTIDGPVGSKPIENGELIVIDKNISTSMVVEIIVEDL
ncbi:uncharacterized protein C5L36_0B01730 [Pichia kudriavzevii]|uniref:NEDD8-activating enzyme E1 catalytic subunit n=1 Tax=Pichia kudriavzevii TaxID=4909 RepID=A0A1V2LKB2_PICKU|nr:uncharacterized protein C5L36_0B01730 [Pichia kudriavzevii]AWU74909.1 hypothetical protein C5L36_0B01730 [Pichia kudriavzevii]ONH73236.1 NEDD8-activating enzyme E1 catalytic subunit [Pichia kudriavzevii]